MFSLPKPSGTARVGTRLLELADAASPGRRITVQVWYPAAPHGGSRRAPYLLTNKRSLFVRLVDSMVVTNAFLDAPIAPGRHAVLVGIPGWGGKRENNSALAESLASNGYVVVGVDDVAHPEIALDFDSEAAAKKSVAWANQKLQQQVHQIGHIITSLERIDAATGSAFQGALDVTRVGLVGFSFGGAVAAETSLHDGRVRAVINLDGSMYGKSLQSGVVKPFLFVTSSTLDAQGAGPSSSIAERYDRANEAQILGGLKKSGSYLLSLKNADHYNFVDAALLPSFRHTAVGTINPVRAHDVVAHYAVRFLDTYVRGYPTMISESGNTFGDLATFRRVTGK
jgi:dienelactone hydrolase